MTYKQQFNKVRDFMDDDHSEWRKRRDSMMVVMKALQRKEFVLKDRLDAETDEAERRHLKDQINIVHAQREKGLKALQNVKVRPEVWRPAHLPRGILS